MTRPASAATRAQPPSPSARCWSTAPPGRLAGSGVRLTSARWTGAATRAMGCSGGSGDGPRNGRGAHTGFQEVSLFFMLFQRPLGRTGRSWRRPCHHPPAVMLGGVLGATTQISEPLAIGVGAGLLGLALVGIVLATVLGRRAGRHSLEQRLSALAARLGVDSPEEEPAGVEPALHHLELVTDRAAEAVAEASADAIRLLRALDTMPQGVIVCDENGEVVFRNARAVGLMGGRHGDALAAQAVVDLLADAWQQGTAERTLDLYGPPRRTLAVRTQLIDDGRRTLGVIAVIDDVSERRRLEEIRRDFVANVSHELKTPMGALGLLAETLVSETDPTVAQRLASRIHTEAFRVSRIIDDLLDLSRIESEESPPREPIYVNLVMAEAVERVKSTAEQRRIRIQLDEPDPPVHV